MTRSRTVVAAISCLSVLALGACSDDDPQPKVEPTSPSTKSAASSPSEPVGPVVPAAAEVITRSGAERFVRTWFRVLSDAMVTGDTDLLDLLSSPDCVSCDALIDRIERIRRKGGTIRTAGWTAEVPTIIGPFAASDVSFVVRVNQAPRVLLDDKGVVVDRTPRMKLPMRVRLAAPQKHWTVTKLEILD